MTPEAADGCWPYEEDGFKQQQDLERRRMQEDLEGAWSRLMADRKQVATSLQGAWSTQEDLKLLKWYLGVE